MQITKPEEPETRIVTVHVIEEQKVNEWAELGRTMADAFVVVRSDAKGYQDRIDRDFPSWREARKAAPNEYWTHDARREFFVTVGTLLESAILSYVLLRDHLADTAWWSDRFSSLSEAKRESSRMEFAIMVKWFSFHGLAMAVEETLRAIQRADADRFKSKRTTIASITEAVLDVADLTEHADLLKLTRLARNTVHTNGMYIPDYGGDEEIVVDEEAHAFTVGVELTWFTDEKLVWFFSQLLAAMDELLRAPPVSSPAVVARGQTPRKGASADTLGTHLAT